MTSSAGAACGTGRVFIFHFRFISADVLMQSHFLCLSALVQSNSCGHCRAGKGVPDTAAPNREPCTTRLGGMLSMPGGVWGDAFILPEAKGNLVNDRGSGCV